MNVFKFLKLGWIGISCLGFLLGCTASKYQYIDNPYGNPIVQNGYQEWVIQSRIDRKRIADLKEKAANRWTTDSQLDRYQGFVHEYERRRRQVIAERERQLKLKLNSFCKASACESFLEDFQDVGDRAEPTK